ncbi:pyridoxamine 5'-phosphate oxidase family protein [Actibacterium sp. 188UL27-1]|uniref:pyridoxamine 5'-phosphate oxidase family protein n=1 Tax=Actibacterium sp. 188UL27-1 TaxID=2786961 RepID=UPI00195BD011|nr:pyridoxamine 5'-phosphate oxidase family protein [Actibacterium sp. 188UL27-1]MBM7069455.1 pyridoxamine 5'-phosphate oxidase family protein [Actibacterium sp. 188UL27-1]
MDTWPNALETTLDEVWRRLIRGVADRRAPARHPTLATTNITGGAEARTVVLRRADRETATVDFHTDAQSTKVSELKANPSASLHIWEPKPRLQIRLRVHAHLLTGTVAEEAWGRVPDGSRSGYGATPPPGSAIDARDAFVTAPGPERFMVVRCEIRNIDTLWLGDTDHRRVLFERSDNWAGSWRVP